MTQGSACRATLGFGTESRWDSRRVEFESPHLSSNGSKSICTLVFPGGTDLLLQRLIHKLKQRLCRRIVRQAEILVKFAVVGFLGREAPGRNAGVLQHGPQPLRLRARIGMVGHVEDEKRRARTQVSPPSADPLARQGESRSFQMKFYKVEGFA